MENAIANGNEIDAGGRDVRIDLSRFERSPRLSEMKVAYRSRTRYAERRTIRGPADVVDYLRAIWNERTLELVEEFVVVCLNGNHQVIGWVKAASGGFASTVVDPRIIFGIALQTASSAIVVAHNHPSGCVDVSDSDRRVTNRLQEAGRLVDVKVLDHIILTRDAAYSFAEGREV